MAYSDRRYAERMRTIRFTKIQNIHSSLSHDMHTVTYGCIQIIITHLADIFRHVVIDGSLFSWTKVSSKWKISLVFPPALGTNPNGD